MPRRPATIPLSLPRILKVIDHTIVSPTTTPFAIDSGLSLARRLNLSAAVVPTSSVSTAHEILFGSSIAIAATVGFPHGTEATDVKVFEAKWALANGATEIDYVVNVQKVRGGEWNDVENEISQMNQNVTGTGGGLLKVIFETTILDEAQIRRLCQICVRVGVAYLVTSTCFAPAPSTNAIPFLDTLDMMIKETRGSWTKVKAGGIDTLDDLVRCLAVGCQRVGTTNAESIIREARQKGIAGSSKMIAVEWN